MHQSQKKGPDRIILFEVGVIISLLCINYVLNLSYAPSNILGDAESISELDEWEVNTTTYPEQEQLQTEPIKVEQTSQFNPVNPIVYVTDKLKDFTIFDHKPKTTLTPPRKRIKPLYIQPNPGHSDTIVDFADILPQFPGGDEARERHIGDNFRFNDQIMMMASEVEVILQFVVDLNGDISQPKILSCSQKGLGIEQEAIRLFKSMPKWKPASVGGKPVRCRMIQPIRLKAY